MHPHHRPHYACTNICNTTTILTPHPIQLEPCQASPPL
jgi:hypothetical protein